MKRAFSRSLLNSDSDSNSNSDSNLNLNLKAQTGPSYNCRFPLIGYNRREEKKLPLKLFASHRLAEEARLASLSPSWKWVKTFAQQLSLSRGCCWRKSLKSWPQRASFPLLVLGLVSTPKAKHFADLKIVPKPKRAAKKSSSRVGLIWPRRNQFAPSRLCPAEARERERFWPHSGRRIKRDQEGSKASLI